MKLYKLEALRGFAALYVVFHHSFSKQLVLFGMNFAFLFKFGQEAVILFFILSGFVIHLSFEHSKNKSFKLYFLKRFLRIFIPLFFAVLLNYWLFFFERGQYYETSMRVIFGNIFMLQDVSALKPGVFCNPIMGNTPLWSLSYEWWFYMIYFFAFKCCNVQSIRYLQFISCFATIFYVYNPVFYLRELVYLQIWLLGVLCANKYKKDSLTFDNDFFISLVFVFFCFILLLGKLYANYTNALNIGVSPFLEVRHFGFAIFVLVGSFLWKQIKWIGFDLIFKVFEPFASISFGIYITHYFLVTNATYLNAAIHNEFVRFIVYLLVCIGVAAIIERVLYPFLQKRILQLVYSQKY